MGGDELAESDEEGDLEGDGAGDGHESVNSKRLASHSKAAMRLSCLVWIMYVRPSLVPGEGEEEDQGGKAESVRDQGGDEQEFGELARGPGALKVTTAMVEGQGCDTEGEDVALDEGGCHKGPRVDER